MFSSFGFSSRPFSASPIPARQIAVYAREGEFGWAAWTYSRQAKLNAWAWHGLGEAGDSNINAWAQLSNSMYLRRENNLGLYSMRPDVFFADGEANDESQSVVAETQWLDFKAPGNLKALTGMDFDGLNVQAVEVYVSVNGGRSGSLADTVLVGNANGGWTYNGEVLPVEAAGTEFKLRFIGHPDLEVQVNRLTLYYDDLGIA
ncbi:MAG: hypothetical protein KF871_10915 [Hydrogenophaga sp.]|uniref:hypothetical protein n=1 Tax=Hydrogenophaga sp. TaxID=1904254 RepID=UPI001D1EA413|nr:hypothetical protein [Hydrogenophaga sp.]MBX3610393.1 hypothetical protein [Hydrogenophaga sp.]